MRKILRILIVGLFLLFAWPWFFYKKYGNTKYKLHGKTVIVANHYSNFDAFFIYLLYGKKKIRFAAIGDAKKRYIPRFFTWLFECIFIETDGLNLKFFRQGTEILQNNGVLCIFPEGVINPRKYGFFDFKSSFAYFAQKTGADILPLYIYPALRLFRRSKIYIGDVVSAREISDKTPSEASTLVQCRIIEYSNSVHAAPPPVPPR